MSWAMDLDPKGVNNQLKENIDKRYVIDSDSTFARELETFNTCKNLKQLLFSISEMGFTFFNKISIYLIYLLLETLLSILLKTRSISI